MPANSLQPPVERAPRWRTRALAVMLVGALGLGGAATANAATLDAGPTHTCAVSDAGSVWCWGDNEDGQVGAGAGAFAAAPTKVAGVGTATEVAVAFGTSCALLDDATVKCWGINTGTGASSSAPVQVPDLTHVVAVDGKQGTFCALSTGGKISCWGFGGGRPVSQTPKDLDGISGAVDLTVGLNEVCAIWTTYSRCFAWTVDSGNNSGVYPPALVEQPASHDIQQLSGSVWDQFGACAVISSGQVSCFGSNNQGQLGNGVVNDGRLPRGESVVTGISDARSVFSVLGAACALRSGGTVSCWGGGSNLPLTSTPGAGPIVSPSTRTDLTDVVALTGGEYHACAADIAGAVRCWGANFRGQLGNGTEVASPTAVLVHGLRVAPSTRDAVTPVRRDDPDITVPAPVAGTTPTGTTPKPTTPAGTTPSPTSPSSTPEDPKIDPRGAFSIRVPSLVYADGTLALAAFRVPARWVGKCPSWATVTAKSGRTSLSLRLPVTAGTDGTCTVTGSVRLTRKLTRAKRLTVKIKTTGRAAAVRRFSAI